MSDYNLKFIWEEFPVDKYYKQITQKTQITLHHTVSGRGAKGDINWWKSDPKKIATHYIIDFDGNVYSLFDTKYWAHHLGITNELVEYKSTKTNIDLNKCAIGIELDSWGGLVRDEKTLKWYPCKIVDNKYVANTSLKPINDNDVVLYPNGYRGFYAFEKYSDKQIETLKKLLQYLGNKHNIPLKYNSDMWFVSSEALNGVPGIWSHTSYRKDKSDIHPQFEIKEMLLSL